MTQGTRIGLSGPDTVRDRVAKRAAGIALICLTAAGAYYFVAAVIWLRQGAWPDWSLRDANVDFATVPASVGASPGFDFVMDASPGLLALLLAASFGLIGALFDRRSRRR